MGFRYARHIYTLYMFQDILTKIFLKKLYLLQFKTINMAYQTLKNEKKDNNNVAWMKTWLGFVNTPHP